MASTCGSPTTGETLSHSHKAHVPSEQPAGLLPSHSCITLTRRSLCACGSLAVQNSQGLCRVVANNADLMAHPYDTMLRVHTQLRECGESPLHTLEPRQIPAPPCNPSEHCVCGCVGVAVPREASESDVAEFVDPSLRHHNRVGTTHTSSHIPPSFPCHVKGQPVELGQTAPKQHRVPLVWSINKERLTCVMAVMCDYDRWSGMPTAPTWCVVIPFL